MSSLLKRHSTLLAFTLSIASSVAFVACGDDDGENPPAGDGGTGGKAGGTGGAKATGGSTGSTGGAKATGGAGGGPSTGGSKSTGGTPGTGGDGGDPIPSNGDAASDASDD